MNIQSLQCVIVVSNTKQAQCPKNIIWKECALGATITWFFMISLSLKPRPQYYIAKLFAFEMLIPGEGWHLIKLQCYPQAAGNQTGTRQVWKMLDVHFVLFWRQDWEEETPMFPQEAYQCWAGAVDQFGLKNAEYKLHVWVYWMWKRAHTCRLHIYTNVLREKKSKNHLRLIIDIAQPRSASY